MIPALLLGRKGSKGFPGKNTTMVCGHPLAYYPMRAALDCPEIDKVYLSTDDEALMAIANETGVEVIVRPPELCSDAALGEHAYVHGYREIILRNGGEVPELLVLLFCNAPTISRELIGEGISALRADEDLDSAVSVSRYNMWSPLRARKSGRGWPVTSVRAI